MGDPIRTYIFAATKFGKLVPGSEGFTSLDEVVFSVGCSNDREMISYLLSNYDAPESTILSMATRGHNISPSMEGKQFLWPFRKALEGIAGEGDISDVCLYGGCRSLREYATDVISRKNDREMEDAIYGDWVGRRLKGEV